MILEAVKRTEVISNTGGGIKTNIDSGSMHILQMLLSENLYSDPETAVIAEYTNNGVDSIIESGKDPIENPVVVTISKDANNTPFSISIKDEGMGLNEEEFGSILGSYLKSTKRESANQIGAFGIGSKSAFSVAESFFYICRKDGIECKFMMYKGEEFTEYQKLYESTTDQPNGVEVIIPIKNQSQYYSFINKAKQKLCYYDTVVLIVEGVIISNRITRNPIVQWSTLNKHQQMHFCLKDVFYTIDWTKLGISPISLPVCLRFGLEDGIMPTPSREGIIWNKQTIELFHNKIAEAIDWFISQYNASVENIEISELPAKINLLNKNNNRSVTLEDTYFNLTGLDKFGSIPFALPKVNGLEILKPEWIYDSRYSFVEEYSVVAEVEYERMRILKRDEAPPVFSAITDFKRKIIEVDGEIPKGNKRIFIYQTVGNSYIIRKTNHEKADLEWYKYELKLKNRVDKKNWRAAIKEWLEIKKTFINLITKFEDYPPTQEWLDARKANRTYSTGPRKRKPKDQISVRVLTDSWNRRNMLSSPKTMLISELDKSETYVYATKEWKHHLVEVKKFGISCYVIPDKDIIKLEANKPANWISYNEFLKGNSPEFKKVMMALKANEIENDLSDSINYFLKHVDIKVEKIFNRLKLMADSEYNISFKFYNIAETKHWYNTMFQKSIEYLNKLKASFDFSFLNYISTSPEGLEIAKEVYNLRREKSKLNNSHLKYV